MLRGPITTIPVPTGPLPDKDTLPTRNVRSLRLNEEDVRRHGGEQTPSQPVALPSLGASVVLDQAVVEALPVPGTKVLVTRNYGLSLWGQTVKIDTQLPGGKKKSYFMKTVSYGDLGGVMMRGEFETLRAIHAVSPIFAPYAHAWGKFETKDASGSDIHFLLEDYREVAEQPPRPGKFPARLAEMHKKSVSPTGKFGFHVTTCHSKLPQVTDCWEDSWAVLYRKQLAHMIIMDTEKQGQWPAFHRVCDLILDKVIPRLLEPLQSEGRSIKPCLIHGNLWDENAATDMDTGEPFIFDGGAFYGHNEYEIGNWRAARHRLSDKLYVRSYKRHFPVSEPEDEWDDRNLLYSLRYDLGTAILIPGCNLRQVVMDNMTLLCEKYCPNELRMAQGRRMRSRLRGGGEEDDEEEEEEEEEDED